MNYTLRDPNGNVLLAVESSPVVTEADMTADLDKVAKACESTFDEVTKYQDAIAVMSSEGFGEQAKAVVSKVLEKVKIAIAKVAEFITRCFEGIYDFFRKSIDSTIAFFTNMSGRVKPAPEVISKLKELVKGRRANSKESFPALSLEYDGQNSVVNSIVANNANIDDVYDGCVKYLINTVSSGGQAFFLYALNDKAVFERIVTNLNENVTKLEEVYPKIVNALFNFQNDLLNGNHDTGKLKLAQDNISQIVEKFALKKFNAEEYIGSELSRRNLGGENDIIVKILDVYAKDSISKDVVSIAKQARGLEERLRKSGIEKQLKNLYASWDKLTKSFGPSIGSAFDNQTTAIIQNTCHEIQNSLRLLTDCIQDINHDITSISRYFNSVCRIEGVITTVCKKISK